MSGGSTDPETRSDEDLMVRYVEAALVEVDRGLEPDLTEICADHPEMIESVAQALGLDSAVARPGSGGSLEGRVLADRYELGECVGLGAMGSVHAATDRRLDRRIAIKLMHAGMFPDASRQTRFVREAKVLAALQHPAVVPIHDHGQTEEGMFYLVMDLLEGVSLAGVLRHVVEKGVALHAEDWAAPLGIESRERNLMCEIVAWTAQLAQGLAASHAAGVFHRDVKPSNVFITTDGRAVLLDFGIAVREGDSALTAADTALGTPWYMAPEQTGTGDTTNASVDVYGLGASLYHLLTGQPPFTGEPAEVLAKLRTEDPEPPGRVQPGLPRDLGAIVEHAIEREARRRYPGMAEFAADLEAFLDHRMVVARPLSGIGRFARRVRRRPARAAAFCTGGLAVTLGAIVWPLWAYADELNRSDEFDRRVATVPALISIEGYPAARLLEDLSESAKSVQLLDELLELKPDDLATRMMRASLHLDRGEREACLDDMRVLEELAPTPYTAALVAAYEGADDSMKGIEAVDLTGLPPATTDLDHLIAGFHALREREDMNRAHDELGAAAETIVPARDLRQLTFLALADKSVNPEDRREFFQLAHDEALVLEGIYGRRTARTRHVLGSSLVGLGKYPDAVQPLRDSLALRDNRHGPLQNLGVAYRRLGRLDEAEGLLRRAHELRPHLWNTLYTLAQVEIDRGNFAIALTYAKKIPETGSMGEAWRRHHLMGTIHLNEAYSRLRSGDQVGSEAVAAAAAREFRTAIANGGTANKVRLEELVAQYMSAGMRTDALVAFLAGWRSDLANPQAIQNLELLLRNRTLGQAEVDFLREYLLRLAIELAPDDPEPRRILKELQSKRR